MDSVTQKRNAYAQTKKVPSPRDLRPRYETISHNFNPLNGSQSCKIRYGDHGSEVTVAMKANGDMPSEQEVIAAIEFFTKLGIEELNITKEKK